MGAAGWERTIIWASCLAAFCESEVDVKLKFVILDPGCVVPVLGKTFCTFSMYSFVATVNPTAKFCAEVKIVLSKHS